MKKKNSVFIALILCLISGALLLKTLFFPKNIRTRISEIRKEVAPDLDTFSNKLASQNKLFDSAQELIKLSKWEEADKIINQFLVNDPKNSTAHVLKGQIFEGRYNYDSAFTEYNYAIYLIPSPFAYDKRAGLFVKLNKYDDALQDYREAYEQNYDFSFQLAKLFESLNRHDSALKYYKEYYNHYPDAAIKIKIDRLQKN